MICIGLLGLFNHCSSGQSGTPDMITIKNDLLNKDISSKSRALKLDSSSMKKMKIIDKAETSDMVTYEIEINSMYNNIKPLYWRVLLAYEKINNQWQYFQHKTISFNIQQ